VYALRKPELTCCQHFGSGVVQLLCLASLPSFPWCVMRRIRQTRVRSRCAPQISDHPSSPASRVSENSFYLSLTFPQPFYDAQLVVVLSLFQPHSYRRPALFDSGNLLSIQRETPSRRQAELYHSCFASLHELEQSSTAAKAFPHTAREE
jgi:hypothetical protein